MAQLRDAKTSELVAEGTPEELVLIADAFDEEVMYDGVGEGFDPDAVRAARNENLEGLSAALSDSDTPDRLKQSIESAIEQAEAAAPDAATIQEVQDNINEARKDWVEE